MRIALRVDASRAIGTGHVRRCLALSHALRTSGAEVCFIVRNLGLDSAAMVAEQGFEAVTLRAPTGQLVPTMPAHAGWAGVPEAADAAETVAAVRKWRPSWMVVDHYAFTDSWHDVMRSGLDCRIAAIDDLADRPLAADLVIDHNYSANHQAKFAGRIAPETALLGGPRFALLGPAFADAPRYAPKAKVRSIGVFMGGIDRENVSALALDAVAETGFAGEVEIVTTSANPNLPALREAAAARPRTRLALDLPNLARFFARHDVQVGAGGGATWERCCIGAPTVLLVVAENQATVVPSLADAGIVVTTDPLGTRDSNAVAASLHPLIDNADLRRTLSVRSRELVDGLGALRVALRLLADEVAVRPARPDDAERMYRWRNHPATRAVSRQSGEIAWEDHCNWFERALKNPACDVMIAHIAEIPVGVVRFDRLSESRVEVSLYLDPALHGLGLGLAALRAAEEAGARGLDIVAEVMNRNVSSARLFKSAGYQRVDANHWIKSDAGQTRAKQES